MVLWICSASCNSRAIELNRRALACKCRVEGGGAFGLASSSAEVRVPSSAIGGANSRLAAISAEIRKEKPLLQRSLNSSSKAWRNCRAGSFLPLGTKISSIRFNPRFLAISPSLANIRCSTPLPMARQLSRKVSTLMVLTPASKTINPANP